MERLTRIQSFRFVYSNPISPKAERPTTMMPRGKRVALCFVSLLTAVQTAVAGTVGQSMAGFPTEGGKEVRLYNQRGMVLIFR